jgi:hypothetical protein
MSRYDGPEGWAMTDRKAIDPLVQDMNSGEPWSEGDLRDLEWCIKHHETTAEIATFLCRSPKEVIEKANELGYKLHKLTGRRGKYTASPRGGAWAGIKRAKV